MSGTVRETKFRMQGVKQGHSSKQWHHEAVTYIKVCTYLLQGLSSSNYKQCKL